MELVQGRIVTDDVERMAAFYGRLVGVAVTLNEYYVEVPTGGASIGFSRCRYTEEQAPGVSGPACLGARRGEVILDFAVDDLNASYERIGALGVDWVLPPTRQLWGARSMSFRDPEGHLINVFSRQEQ